MHLPALAPPADPEPALTQAQAPEAMRNHTMTRKIPFDAYIKSEKTTTRHPDGAETVVREPDEEVSQEWVKKYVDAIGFFESLGGTETIRVRQGIIHTVSTSPDRTEQREMVFTPIKNGPRL